jgi:hypothetical protein
VRDLLEYRDCSDLEILPSGANALMTCGTHLVTIRLATGKTTHETALPSRVMAYTLDGRLDPTTLLLPMGSRTGQWLAALDLTTMRTRTLPCTAARRTTPH